MRRTALLLAAAAAILLPTAAGAADAAGIELVPTRGAKFPDRLFNLRLPQGMQIEPGTISVFENGEPVSDLAIAPASSVRDRRQFGTVLVLDASNSMRGAPMKGAMAAARAFAARRNINQSLAVVTFNRGGTVRLPFTRSASEIDAALASAPRLAEQTYLYDGVKRALDLLEAGGIKSGTIVVLSDGADTGSKSNADEVLQRARSQRVRIFAVGLESKQFTPSELQRLAYSTSGTYSQAGSAADLARIYDALGYHLASEYLLEYRSFAGPEEEVTVSVRVKGIDGIVTTEYQAPKLPAAPPAAPFQRSAFDQFVQSPLTMIIVAVVIAALFGLTAVLTFQPRTGGVLMRLGAFVSLAQPEEAKRQTAALSERLLSSTDRSLSRTAWWARFKLEVEIADVPLPADQIIVLTAVTTLLGGWLATLLVPAAFAVFALGIPFLVFTYIRQKAERQRRAFGEQLPDNLQVLSSALRAGHSLIGALSVVVDDAPEPSRREFGRVVTDEQLGVPIEDSLTRIGVRMRSRDLDQVALVAALQRETGGNSAEVLDQVATTIRDRAALRRLVRTLTAQGRMARWIISGLPVALLVMISILNSAYMQPLYSRTAGQLMLAGAALMVIAGSLAIKKIINIKI